jgi:hypothetical protein
MSVIARSKSAVAKKREVPFAKSLFIELIPQGVVLGLMENRPMLLLRSITGDHTLPVWLNEVQTPVVLAEMGHNGGFDRAHGITLKIINRLGGTIDRCVFVELSGVHQFVEIHISQVGGATFVERTRADEAMGLVLANKAKILATVEFIESCRSLQMDSRDLGISADVFDELQKTSNRLLQ